MTQARGYERKAHLTPEEKLKVAYFYLLRGVAMHVLADMFDVNAGRVADAIREVRAALKFESGDPEAEEV
jgi:transposase-like protein